MVDQHQFRCHCSGAANARTLHEGRSTRLLVDGGKRWRCLTEIVELHKRVFEVVPDRMSF
jgi:hypothetical protein